MGPLAGLRVIEFSAIGPVPFAGMLLSDMGADIVRVDRIEGRSREHSWEIIHRGRRAVALNLKDASDVAQVLALADRAEIVMEGFRPTVMERLGLGPDVLLARNPALVYGRLTGWGQSG